MSNLSMLINRFYNALIDWHKLYLEKIKKIDEVLPEQLFKKINKNNELISKLSIQIKDLISSKYFNSDIPKDYIIKITIINKIIDQIDTEKRISNIEDFLFEDYQSEPFYYSCHASLCYVEEVIHGGGYYSSYITHVMEAQIKIIICTMLKKKVFFNKYKDNIKSDIDIIYSLNEKFEENNWQIVQCSILYSLIKFYILHYLSIKYNRYERKVAHYTNIDVAKLLIERKTKLRLVSPEFMNDPSEGNMLFKFMNIDLSSDDLEQEHRNFFTCFTFNHNSLNQFRLYGRKEHIECSGVSLTINKDFFKKTDSNDPFELYRCIYLEPKTGYIEVAKRSKWSFFQEYAENKSIDDIEKLYRRYNKINGWRNEYLRHAVLLIKSLLDIYENNKNKFLLKVLSINLNSLKYIFKHFAFSEEEECRLMTFQYLSSDNVLYDEKLNSTYICHKEHIADYLDNIYLGVASKDLLTAVKFTVLKHCKNNVPKVKVSENPFRAHKFLNKLTTHT